MNQSSWIILVLFIVVLASLILCVTFFSISVQKQKAQIARLEYRLQKKEREEKAKMNQKMAEKKILEDFPKREEEEEKKEIPDEEAYSFIDIFDRFNRYQLPDFQ